MDTIIYHGNCPDGFCAAYVAQKRYPGAQLVPAIYGKPIDDAVVRGKDVLVVDFSWPRAETERLAALARSIQILDHHMTAEKELAGLPYAVFDMNRSGAQMAWDWCRDFEYPRPWYVDYVADRDLWRFKLPSSKIVNAYLMTLPHTIEAWDKLLFLALTDVVSAGAGARSQVDYYVTMVTAEARRGRFTKGPDFVDLDLKLLIVNAAYPSISDVAHVLCEQGADVGVGWFVRGDGQMQFSLRSIGDLDVSAIARIYGGGGHKNAAGFQMPAERGWELLSYWQADFL